MQKGLGGDAPVVQAGAAELVLFDQGHGHAELAGAQGAGVTAAATTQDHQVELASATTPPGVRVVSARAAHLPTVGPRATARANAACSSRGGLSAGPGPESGLRTRSRPWGCSRGRTVVERGSRDVQVGPGMVLRDELLEEQPARRASRRCGRRCSRCRRSRSPATARSSRGSGIGHIDSPAAPAARTTAIPLGIVVAHDAGDPAAEGDDAARR